MRRPWGSANGRLDRRPDRRWRSTDGLDDRRQPARALLVALVLASISVITLDYHGGSSSPVEPARQAVGEVFGPIESGTSAAIRPFTSLPGWFRSRNDLHEQVIALRSENAKLRSQAARAGYDRNRLEEYDGLTAAAKSLGTALVPARVIAMGPSQSFNRTVMIDAGSDSGVHPDQTVLVVARRAAGSAFTLPLGAGRHLFGSEPGGTDLATGPDGAEVPASPGSRLDVWELATE